MEIPLGRRDDLVAGDAAIVDDAHDAAAGRAPSAPPPRPSRRRAASASTQRRHRDSQQAPPRGRRAARELDQPRDHPRRHRVAVARASAATQRVCLHAAPARRSRPARPTTGRRARESRTRRIAGHDRVARARRAEASASARRRSCPSVGSVVRSSRAAPRAASAAAAAQRRARRRRAARATRSARRRRRARDEPPELRASSTGTPARHRPHAVGPPGERRQMRQDRRDQPARHGDRMRSRVVPHRPRPVDEDPPQVLLDRLEPHGGARARASGRSGVPPVPLRLRAAPAAAAPCACAQMLKSSGTSRAASAGVLPVEHARGRERPRRADRRPAHAAPVPGEPHGQLTLDRHGRRPRKRPRRKSRFDIGAASSASSCASGPAARIRGRRRKVRRRRHVGASAFAGSNSAVARERRDEPRRRVIGEFVHRREQRADLVFADRVASLRADEFVVAGRKARSGASLPSRSGRHARGIARQRASGS